MTMQLSVQVRQTAEKKEKKTCGAGKEEAFHGTCMAQKSAVGAWTHPNPDRSAPGGSALAEWFKKRKAQLGSYVRILRVLNLRWGKMAPLKHWGYVVPTCPRRLAQPTLGGRVHVCRSLCVQGLNQVDDSKDQECHSTTDSHYTTSQVSTAIKTAQKADWVKYIPTFMLTFPAMARPPMTATPVQQAWPRTAPRVTHQ